MSENITITKAEYESLLDKSAHMDELRARGVDNWEGYVGSSNYCGECDEEISWSTTECPSCKSPIEEEY